MSVREYKASQELELKAMDLDANAFYSLIMAAMRTADTDNLWALRAAFPGVFEELAQRRNAPGGMLPDE